MNDGKTTATPEATGPDTGLAIRQYYVMVGIGAFVTTLAQPAVIGRLPFSLLLKNQLHFNAETLAQFQPDPVAGRHSRGAGRLARGCSPKISLSCLPAGGMEESGRWGAGARDARHAGVSGSSTRS